MGKYSFCGLTGRIVTPVDPEYNELRQEWNEAVQKYPLVIVYCTNRFDVSNAVLWSRANGVSLRIRCGGHNYEGYSTGNNVIVIDLSPMNSVRIDENNNRLKIQAGVNNKQLYDAVASLGYPFPGGTCPSVCVSGYVCGGGWGLSGRFLGLGCDSLRELEMINYQGEKLTANSQCNADLFAACKGGGGGNFGVIISMTFVLPPKVDKVTLVELYYPEAGVEQQGKFLQVWQNWLKCADERITLSASVYNSPTEGLSIFGRGIFYGTPEDAEVAINPLIELGGVSSSFEYMTFYAAVTKIGESYPPSEMFKSTGRFVCRDYTPAQSLKIANLINDRPEGSVFAAISVYALGGRIRDIDPCATAFYYRHSRYIMGIQTVWEDSSFKETNVEWLEPRFKYLQSVTDGSYVNFPYSELDNYMEEYYGGNVYWLRQVKKKYDPGNVFRFPQSIRFD